MNTSPSILCATDFSPLASAAADVAARLAMKLHLPLRLLHVDDTPVMILDLPIVVESDNKLRIQLSAEADRLREMGVTVVDEFERGNPARVIITMVKEKPPALIVMGSTGRSGLGHPLIGSVAEEVAESAPIPTLVLREPNTMLEWLDQQGSLRLLCGMDFTGSADVAIAAVKTLMDLGQVEVEAAYVAPRNDPLHTEEQRLIRQHDAWERIHAVLGDMPIKVHLRESSGHAPDDFLLIAEDRQPGLLIVGTHQRHGLQRLEGFSFSRRVLARTKTNVLCVPAACHTHEHRIPEIHRVLVATDFSEGGTEAIRHAHSLLPNGGHLRILHVCELPLLTTDMSDQHPPTHPEHATEAQQSLNALPSHLLNVPDNDVTTEIVSHWDLSLAIMDAADRFAADAICMGAHGQSRTRIAFLGSTVQAVLERSHRPIYLITPPLV